MTHLLILEDDEQFGRLLCASLKEAGFTVDLCRDATTAYASFQEYDTALVIADLIVEKDNRPYPDGGLTLISRIRRHSSPRHRAVPIIAISGVIESQGLQSALTTAQGVGATATMEKPFAPAELLDLISDLLADNASGSAAG